MEQTERATKRIHLMDELRGFAVFCMVFYHAFYTLAYLFNLEFGKALLNFFMPAEPWFAGLFILIAGISSNLSHSNLLRGLKLAGIAAVVTLVTWLVVPAERILFGILHFLAICMILFGLIQPHLLLPATTALGTIRPDGRERGLQAGANVVMPNLSPLGVRKKYALYDGKLCTGEEAAQCIGCLSRRVASVGCRIVTARGYIIR